MLANDAYRTEPWFGDLGRILVAAGEPDLLQLDTRQLTRELLQHRTLLLRGYATSLDIFRKFTDRFSGRFLVHRNPYVRPRNADEPTITEAVAGNERQNLHAEMHYGPSRPDIVFFNCHVAAESAGETTLCDGLKLWLALGPDTRRLFEAQRIRYTYKMPLEQCRAAYGWQSVPEAVGRFAQMGYAVRVDDADANLMILDFVCHAYTESRLGRAKAFQNSIVDQLRFEKVPRPTPTRITFEDGSAIPNDVLAEIVEVGERLAQLVAWRPHELLMVDNSTVLHGRRAFVGPRLIVTRFAENVFAGLEGPA